MNLVAGVVGNIGVCADGMVLSAWYYDDDYCSLI